ncbi:hypothetical protein EWM64_g7926 [Hericium alpestre]|uniref:Endonuclease/exonuclease/phosphatase domain-containing protein n=1 Tax=Hericium alpestre TaxID=135208 RepID=A0A4Y9ZPV7_9AGAM|nr:hypothetical protein EWM64_g7926 [Hericium alpestre]
MLNRRIAIAALQETHLTEPRLASLDRLFSKRLLVLSSPDPDNPGACAGVAFAINKDLLHVSDYRFVELIPGRAIALTICWYDSDAITLLNIYAPNEATRHADFWRGLRTSWHRHHLPQPDFMLGDFNLVEDGLDRAPAHPDVKTATNVLMAFRTHFHLQDTWRHTHPRLTAATPTAPAHCNIRDKCLCINSPTQTHLEPRYGALEAHQPST